MKKLFNVFGTVLFSMVFVAVCFLTTTYAQTWIQVNIDGFGDANNKVAIGFGEYGNFFYMGVANNITGCEVWRTAAVGGPPFTDWTQVNTDGFGDANNSWPGHAVYDNLLYVSPENGVTGVEIWQYNGTTWTQVNTDGFGDVNNGNAHLLAHNNFLYAATGNEVTGCEVWRTAAVGGPPFTDWTQVNTDGFGEVIGEDAHPAVYDNFLYVAVDNGCDPITGGTQVWRYDGGTTWTKVNTNGFGDTNNEQAHLIVYDNLLYAVVNNDLGLQIWQYNGATWRQVNTDGFGDVNNDESGGQAVHDGYLYVTTDNDITGCEVWRTAAVGGPPFTDWTQVNTNGFGDVNNSDAKLSVYNSSLYAGSLNEVTGAEVWRYLLPTLDIDGNGQYDALTDGILILRYLFGFRGAVLIDGAVAPDCTRCTAPEIEAYLEGLMP